MKNPFMYGKVVTGEKFCNREREQQQLKRLIASGQNILIYAERRIGKTSLIKEISQKLPKQEYLVAYIDVSMALGETSFIEITALGIATATSRKLDEIVNIVKTFFKGLDISLDISQDGGPTFHLKRRTIEDAIRQLELVLEASEKIAKQRKKRMVIVFDEIQEILTYGNDIIEKKLRSIIQHQQHVSYIFMGSRKHLITEMFLKKSRPFYQSSTHFPLSPISATEWNAFIKEKFKPRNIRISDKIISDIIQLTEGHPHYTQHICSILWTISDGEKEIDAKALEKALEELVSTENYAYQTLWDLLTLSQKKTLYAIANTHKAKLYSEAIKTEFSLGAFSTIDQSIKSLIKKDLIEPENGYYIINDRFFRYWLQQKQP